VLAPDVAKSTEQEIVTRYTCVECYTTNYHCHHDNNICLRLIPDDSLKLKLAKKVKMSSKRLVQSIPLDDTGRPILPIELGNLVIYCLGEVGGRKT